MHDNYNDIIDLPHHQSARHPRMPIEERAAQFSPFAALAGYGDVVRETARLTEDKKYMLEDQMEKLDAILGMLREHIGERPYIAVTCFKPDPCKDGGEYIRLSGHLKKIDDANRKLVFVDGTSVPAGMVTDILFNPGVL